MEFLEAAKKYISENDPNHWLTKDLTKLVERQKSPAWAIKELEKKKYLTLTPTVDEVREEKVECSPFFAYDNIDLQWAEWVATEWEEPEKSKELAFLKDKYKDVKVDDVIHKRKTEMTDADFAAIEKGNKEGEKEMLKWKEVSDKARENEIEKLKKEEEEFQPEGEINEAEVVSFEPEVEIHTIEVTMALEADKVNKNGLLYKKEEVKQKMNDFLNPQVVDRRK